MTILIDATANVCALLQKYDRLSAIYPTCAIVLKTFICVFCALRKGIMRQTKKSAMILARQLENLQLMLTDFLRRIIKRIDLARTRDRPRRR